MSEINIRKWLSNITETVNAKNLKEHMDLVSKSVIIYGMPSGKTIDFAGWKRRRESEFKRNLIKNILFDKLKIKNYGIRRLTFDIEETIEGIKGDKAIINKQIILEEEQDDKWRVVEETINSWKFIKH